MNKITRILKEKAYASGIDLIGITSAKPFEVSGTKKKTIDPKELLKGAASVVVAGFCFYYQLKDENCYQKEPRGIFSYGSRSFNPLRRHCQKIIQEILKKEGYQCVSSMKIPAKMAAVRAGLGRYGKNSVVLTEKLGSWVMFECLITDAPLETADNPIKLPVCDNCNICLKDCPTQAINEDYSIERKRCITNWLWGTYVPRELREKQGIRLFGCGECLKMCPANNRVKPRENFPVVLENYSDNPQLIPLAAGNKEYYRNVVPSFPRWAGIEAIRGNAIIALGNTGDPKAISVLKETLQYPKPQIRAYSAWALGKIGGKKAKTILEKALSGEKSSKVIFEIKLALYECSAQF
jgi:epoxyqueuosine reductase